MDFCEISKEFYKRYYPKFKIYTDTFCKEIYIELEKSFLIRVECKSLDKNSISVDVVIYNKNELYLKEYWSNIYEVVSIDEIFKVIDKETEEAKYKSHWVY